MSTVASTFTGLAALNVVVVYLRDALRAFDSRVAARKNASIVATHVSPSAIHPEFLSVYLATIPFVNGDAWEALR